MRVLYVNHTARVSGGEQSLLTFLPHLPEGIDASVACPAGPLRERVEELGLQVHQLPGTDGSLKLHPWHTTRALAELTLAALTVRRLAADLGADLVHANSIRAGIAASMAARLGGAPAIVHVRDCLPDTRATAAVFSVIRSGASLVLANSRYTADALAERAGPRVDVLHSPVDADRFDPKHADRDRVRAALGVPSESPLAALVGQITPWKGQDTAIRALAHARRERPDLRLLLVGSTKFTTRATRYDNQTYLRELHALVAELGLEDHVIFAGETADVAGTLAAADLALVPSTEEPFGRVVIEALAMGLPVIATSVGGPREIIRDGRDGLLIPPGDAEAWGAAIARLAGDGDLRRRMGESGRERVVGEFAVDAHAERLLEVYEELLGSVRRGPSDPRCARGSRGAWPRRRTRATSPDSPA
jgi:glycosyltransferase involved in cell wall biosynthesis